jgi:hypothetical protein
MLSTFSLYVLLPLFPSCARVALSCNLVWYVVCCMYTCNVLFRLALGNLAKCATLHASWEGA